MYKLKMASCIVSLYLLLTMTGAAEGKLLVISSVVDNSLTPTLQPNNLAEGNSQTLDFRFTSCGGNSTGSRNIALRLSEGAERNLNFPKSVYNVPCLHNETTDLGVEAMIEAKMLGFVSLEITDEQTGEVYLEYAIGITRPPSQVIDQVYIYGLMALICISNFNFGINLDLEKVKKFVKRPVAPGIGVLCQFILMPLLGFSIAMAMTDAHKSEKLGIFAGAVAPGGGLSNVWIFVLKGDLDLSITMTFVSTIAAVAFLPLWFYTLGTYIIGGTSITLPFANIAQSLAMLVVPLFIGLVVNRFLPRVARKVSIIQKPIIMILIVFAVVLGIWSNFYAFALIFTDARLAVCTFLLPYAGGIFGFLIALAAQQGKKLAMTIGIETGIQNLNVAVVLLRTSLPQPWADISSAIPLVMSLFTFTPFPFFVAAQQIYQRCVKKKEDGDSEASTIAKQSSLELGEKGEDNPAVILDKEELDGERADNSKAITDTEAVKIGEDNFERMEQKSVEKGVDNPTVITDDEV